MKSSNNNFFLTDLKLLFNKENHPFFFYFLSFLFSVLFLITFSFQPYNIEKGRYSNRKIDSSEFLVSLRFGYDELNDENLYQMTEERYQDRIKQFSFSNRITSHECIYNFVPPNTGYDVVLIPKNFNLFNLGYTSFNSNKEDLEEDEAYYFYSPEDTMLVQQVLNNGNITIGSSVFKIKSSVSIENKDGGNPTSLLDRETVVILSSNFERLAESFIYKRISWAYYSCQLDSPLSINEEKELFSRTNVDGFAPSVFNSSLDQLTYVASNYDAFEKIIQIIQYVFLVIMVGLIFVICLIEWLMRQENHRKKEAMNLLGFSFRNQMSYTFASEMISSLLGLFTAGVLYLIVMMIFRTVAGFTFYLSWPYYLFVSLMVMLMPLSNLITYGFQSLFLKKR